METWISINRSVNKNSKSVAELKKNDLWLKGDKPFIVSINRDVNNNSILTNNEYTNKITNEVCKLQKLKIKIDKKHK